MGFRIIRAGSWLWKMNNNQIPGPGWFHSRLDIPRSLGRRACRNMDNPLWRSLAERRCWHRSNPRVTFGSKDKIRCSSKLRSISTIHKQYNWIWGSLTWASQNEGTWTPKLRHQDRLEGHSRPHRERVRGQEVRAHRILVNSKGNGKTFQRLYHHSQPTCPEWRSRQARKGYS